MRRNESEQLLRICGYDHGGYVAWGWWKSWDGPGGLKDFMLKSISRLDQFPRLKWGFHIEGATWDWVLDNDPAFVNEFKSWVEQEYAGRISLASGGYGQPLSCTIGGEANVRHLVYDHEVYARLGHPVQIYMRNEHGFFPQLPQLLRGVGIDKAILRTIWGIYGICPEIDGSKVRWRAPDGSWVEAIPTYVGGNCGLSKNAWDTRIIIGLEGPIDFEPFRRHFLDRGIRYPVAVRIDDYPLPREDDGSGGFARLCSFSDRPGYRWVTGEEAFAEIPLEDVTLDTTIDDYPIQMPWGYYGNVFWNLSRQAEVAALTAERLAAMNVMCGGAHWEETLDRVWRVLLTAQHHDVNICGASSGGEFGELMLDAARRLYGEAIELANTVTHANLKAMLARLASEPSDRVAVVYNPLNWARRAVVPIRVKSEKKKLPAGFRVTRDGQPVEFQILSHEVTPGGYISHTKLGVPLDLPPMGFATVNVDLLSAEPEASTSTRVVETSGDITIETHWGHVRIDRTSGEYLAYDLSGQPLLVPGARNGLLRATVNDEPYVSEPDSVTVLAHGPLLFTVRTCGSVGPLAYTTDATVYRDQPRIDFQATVEVHGETIGETYVPSEWEGKDEVFVQDKKLLVQFTPVLEGPATVAQDFPFSVDRTRNRDINAGCWVDVSDGERGMTLANRGTMGYLWDGASLANVLLYSGKYSWGEVQAFLDGSYTLSYSLSFHQGSERTVVAHRVGLEYNWPPVSMARSPGKGTLQSADVALSVLGAESGEPCANLIVSALYTRKSQLYLRVYDFAGKTTTTKVTVGGQAVALVPVNLLCDQIGDSATTALIPAYGISTLRVVMP